MSIPPYYQGPRPSAAAQWLLGFLPRYGFDCQATGASPKALQITLNAQP